MGPGLLESIYEEGLCRELTLRSIPFERQKPLSIAYKGAPLDGDYRLDLLVAGAVVVEIKIGSRSCADLRGAVTHLLETGRLEAGFADQLQCPGSERRHPQKNPLTLCALRVSVVESCL